MIEDTIPPQYVRRQPVKLPGVLLGFGVAVLLGMALTLQVRGWGLVGSVGGRCSGQSCPQGATALLIPSFLALFVLIPITIARIVSQLNRRDIVGRAVALATVIVIPAGIWPGNAIYHWAHGATLNAAWIAPLETDRSVRLSGQGSWLYQNTMIRSRPDRLASFDLATGRVVYTYVIPDPQLLCGMSRSTGSGIGLIAYGPENGHCQHVAALDLATGRVLWQKDLTGESLTTSMSTDFISVSGDLAVVRAAVDAGPNARGSRGGMQAFDLRTGAPRWHHEATDYCSFEAVGGQVTVLVRCVAIPTSRSSSAVPRIGYAVRSYDAAGKQRWETPIPYNADNANVDAISYEPLVLHVRETNTRGTDQILSFNESGRIQARINAGGYGASGELEVAPQGFKALPVRPVAVAQGVMVVGLRTLLNGRGAIAAYGLADGRQLWTHPMERGEQLQAVTVSGDRAVALIEQGFGERLRSYQLRDGTKRDLGTVPLKLLTATIGLYAGGGGYVIVNDKGSSYPPVAFVR